MCIRARYLCMVFGRSHCRPLASLRGCFHFSFCMYKAFPPSSRRPSPYSHGLAQTAADHPHPPPAPASFPSVTLYRPGPVPPLPSSSNPNPSALSRRSFRPSPPLPLLHAPPPPPALPPPLPRAPPSARSGFPHSRPRGRSPPFRSSRTLPRPP